MPFSFKSILNYRNPLLYIFLLGLCLRLLFLWKGAAIYYGPDAIHENGDTLSYVNSFKNLVTFGHYSYDINNPVASFGRVPGFPFFYGIHYLIFGEENAYLATSVTQIILDCIAILFFYAIILKLVANNYAALSGALIYATYPFIIVWVTIMGSELLANFFILFYFFVLVTWKRNWLYYFTLGILVALAFFTREFLGIFAPITALFILITTYKEGVACTVKNVSLFGIAFLLLYLPWPIRNYLNHNQLVLVKPAAAGYPNLAPDALSYLKFVDSWSVDNLEWFTAMKQETPIHFPSSIFENEQDKNSVSSLVNLSRTCGTGFYFRKYNKPYPYAKNCNSEIEAGFTYLTEQYKKNQPFQYWVIVPLKKLKKGIFKASLINSDKLDFKQAITSILFIYRSLLIVLGISAFLFIRKSPPFLIISLYTFFIYFFICVQFRSIEIRYFLQADVLLLIPATILLTNIFYKNLLQNNKSIIKRTAVKL